MKQAQNVMVRQQLRIDHLQYGRVLVLPEDLPQEVIDAEFGDAIKKGLLKSPVKSAVIPAEKVPAGTKVTQAGVSKPAVPGESVSYPPPAVTQLWAESLGAGTRSNVVSESRFGPCILKHIHVLPFTEDTGADSGIIFGVHISKNRNVGPFSGEITVIEFFDPLQYTGVGSGAKMYAFKQEVDTAVGWRTHDTYEFFPEIVIPFNQFFVSVSNQGVNHPADALFTFSFGLLTMPKGALAAQPTYADVRAATVTVERMPPAVPTAYTVRFQNYAQIKTFEALGNKIVWSTIRNTTDPRMPIEVTVVSKL